MARRSQGSGDPVTPETVFRWASVSKGVAATMVAKLAEQGKINLKAPVANYAPDLKLPAGNEYRATVGDLLSHRLGLYRNAYDNKLEEGQDPSLLRASLAQLNAICAPGTCWTYQNVAYRRVERDGLARHRHALRAGGQALSVQPDRDDAAAACRMAGLESNKSWARPHSAGQAAAADGRHLLQGSRRRRHQQQHQGHGAVDAGADGRDARRARRASVLDTIHAPYVVTPTERGRLRKFLERLGTAWYGYGWRSYDYAGHHIIGHRGGISGYRSLILFDPAEEERRRRAVEQQHQAARRARVRGDGHDLPPAVPRLAGARQARPGAVDRRAPKRSRRTAAATAASAAGLRPSSSSISRCWLRCAL